MSAESETPAEFQLNAIDAVEQLTYEVENAAADEGQRAMARAVRGDLNVLRAHVYGKASDEVASAMRASLQTLGERLRNLTGHAELAELGVRVADLGSVRSQGAGINQARRSHRRSL